MAPKSALSFVYRITLEAPYRDEMHHDIREAFKRFGIDRDMMRRLPGNPDARLERFEKASYDIERAAYAGRTPAEQNIAKTIMPPATQDFFNELVPLLALEIEHGVPGPDLPAPPPNATNSLLCAVHFLFYSRAFRASNPTVPNVPGVQNFSSGLAPAWDFVRAALERAPGARPPAAQVTPALTTLANELASEFSGSLWSDACW